MNNFFTYVINLRDQMTGTLNRVSQGMRRANRAVNQLRNDVNRLNNSSLFKIGASVKSFLTQFGPIAAITSALLALRKAFGDSQQAYTLQNQAEQRLAAVMRNTMDARREDVKGIYDFIAAQEKIGVIATDIQTAGAQELSTYLTQKSTLEKLIPVMNDMAAQQYGLSASQEQATNIASMLGKVMDGQVGALSRYGYKFDKAQEKVLKFGTESQRAAVLVDVVSGSVGGMNEALATTPDGIFHKQSLELGGLMVRAGKLIVMFKNQFGTLVGYLTGVADRMLSFFERNETQLKEFANMLSNTLVAGFRALGTVVSWIYGLFSWFFEGLNRGRVGFVAFAAALAGLSAGLLAYRAIVFAIVGAVKLWGIAQSILNVILTMNPIGLIIAAVVALIALITFLIVKIDGWGEAWQNTINGCKLIFQTYIETIKFQFNTMLNGLMIGLNKIQEGWYKFKNAVGLGDSSQNNAMLARLQADTDRRKQEIVEGAKKIVDLGTQSMQSFKNAAGSFSVNDTTLSDVANGLKNKLGIGAPNVPGMDNGAGSGAFGGDGGGGEESGSAASAIATGGTKTTNITLNLGNLIQTMNVNSKNAREGAERVRDIVLDELSRAINMAQANV